MGPPYLVTLAELKYIFLTRDYTLLTLFERVRIHYFRLLVGGFRLKSSVKIKRL